MSEQFINANGLSFCYEVFGKTTDPAILLIMGLGTQMIAWPNDFCESLAQCNFRVIRFDNRDVGLSTKIDYSKRINLAVMLFKKRLGIRSFCPYKLEDMADDAIALLNALSIDKAHVVGASMGGMIAQLVAFRAYKKTLSLTSIMSSSGRRGLPAPKMAITRAMMKPVTGTQEEMLPHRIAMRKLIGSQGSLAMSDNVIKDLVLKSLKRSVYPRGYVHHLAAIIQNGSREAQLKMISAPTLIIHGKADALVPYEAGIDTAKLIKHSKLELIEEMGHDIPIKIIPTLVSQISRHALSAS